MNGDTTIRIKDIIKDISKVKKDGDKILIDDSVDKAIAQLKVAENQIKEAITIIKEHAKAVADPLNAKSLRGKYCTISISAPRKTKKYIIDLDEVDPKFVSTELIKSANIEEINKYIEKESRLPTGITKAVGNPVVSIRTKTGTADDLFLEVEDE
jgi:hypothetical protein